MNKHSSRLRSKNDIRRNTNHYDSLIVWTIISEIMCTLWEEESTGLIKSSDKKVSYLPKQDSTTQEYIYDLTAGITELQGKMGIQSYKLRESKIKEIITILQSLEIGALPAPLRGVRWNSDRSIVLEFVGYTD